MPAIGSYLLYHELNKIIANRQIIMGFPLTDRYNEYVINHLQKQYLKVVVDSRNHSEC